MNYEEKYKLALERARHYYLTGKGEPVDFIKMIFPELLESEDERIRKCIIELVKQSSEILDKQNQNNMIAWLEKQCENKSADDKKLDVLKFIRKETCCGLAEANNALLKLIKVLKEHPLPIMDKPRKLKIEWEDEL